MILSSSCGFTTLINLILLSQGTQGYKTIDGFSYPESEEENPANQHQLHKQPVQTSRCKEGELLYPGDQADDWVCDCKPGYIYYPQRNQCFSAYRQGPCPSNEYLILPKNSVIPVCILSPCAEKKVLFRNVCHELGKAGPCPLAELGNVIAINETTLEIVCTLGFTEQEVRSRVTSPTKIDFISRIDIYENSTTEKYPKKECFIGGIRWVNEGCRQKILTQQNVDERIESIFSTGNL